MRCLVHVVAATVILVAGLGAAEAASPQEDLVKRWLESASFGLPVSIGGSRFDAARQAVELTDVRIGDKEKNLVAVTLPDLTVEDPRRTAAGLFAAHAVRSSGLDARIRVDFAAWFPDLARLAAEQAATPAPSPAPDGGGTPDGNATPEGGAAASEPEMPPAFDVTVTSETILIERYVAPLDPPVIPQNADLLGKYVALLKASLVSRADWTELNNLKIETSGAPDGDSVTTYAIYYASGVHDGRAERVEFSGMEQTQSIDGTMISTKVESSHAVGIDANALLEVIDPAAYVGGKGDGRWRTAIAQQGYDGVEITFPNGSATLGSFEMNGFRVRQTEKPPFAMLSTLLSDPKIVEKEPERFLREFLPGVVRFYGVDLVTADDFEVKVTEEGMSGPVSLKIGSFDLNRADSDGVAAITFRDFAVDAADAGSGSLDLMTMNNLRFGSLDVWLDVIAATADGGEPDPKLVKRAVIEGSPALDFFELSGLSVEMPDATIGLDAFAVTSSDYLFSLPRRYETTFTKFSMPVALITDPAVKDPLTKMGYETLAVSGAYGLAWDTDKGDVRIEDATLKVEDMGTLSMDVHLGNLPLSILDDPMTIETRMQEGTLVSAGLTFGNQSIVEKTFEMQSKEMNQKPEDFRTNFADALPLMLGFLDDKRIQTTFADVLKTFFKDPQSLVVTLKPSAPLPFTVLDTIESEAPGEVLKLLGFDMKANQ